MLSILFLLLILLYRNQLSFTIKKLVLHFKVVVTERLNCVEARYILQDLEVAVETLFW